MPISQLGYRKALLLKLEFYSVKIQIVLKYIGEISTFLSRPTKYYATPNLKCGCVLLLRCLCGTISLKQTNTHLTNVTHLCSFFSVRAY